MYYRAEYNPEPTGVADVFDGTHYRHLCREFVRVGMERLGHRFFELGTDIALALSTDGVGPFKSRKKTCWPLLLFNLNLPPEIRFHIVHIICLGVIPGPRAPHDFDSFIFPLFLELETLMRGVTAFNAEAEHRFTLHAYLLYIFGDMPAIAKLMRMKGVNGYSPCRMCLIHGIADPAKPRTLYTPLHRNNGDPYRPRDLPLRSHRQFIEQARSVLNDESDALSREYGINGIPLLASISSLSIPHSFPFDFMHLVGNIVPSLVAHWTGTFKEMTNGNEDYIIDPAEWEEIGRACSSSGDTVPTAFGSRVPNIATERYQFKTENWFTFLMFLGPALLHGHLATPYYRHFLKLVNIFNLCLKYFMTNNEIEQLENAVIQWVEDYER